MPVIEYATDPSSYTMDPASDVLYLYSGLRSNPMGQMVTGSNGVGNDRDNIIYGVEANGIPHSGNNVIDAGAGNDTVFGYSGNDAIYGGDGNDRLDGGAGGDHLYGGAGNDVIRTGNGDNTTLVYAWWGTAWSFITQESWDYVDGGDGDDRIISDGFDALHGGAGNDRFILNGVGNILAYGEDGDDRFFVHNTAAHISGGDGYDIVNVYGNYNMERLADDIERLVVRTNDGASIMGRFADDNIIGAAGNDTLSGGTGGSDRLVGNDGDDMLMVGSDTSSHAGKVNLFGGAGADTFYFGGPLSGDRSRGADDAIIIRDFEDGVDKIRLATNLAVANPYSLYAETTVTKINNTGQSFNNLYNQAKSVHQGTVGMSIGYFEFNGNTYVVKDSSVYPTAQEFSFRLTGVHDLSLSDFILDGYYGPY